MRGIGCCIAAGVAAALAGPARLAMGQSLLDRSPNLSGGWVGESGTLQFNFIHRFSVTDAPTRKVTNSPTFLLSYRLPFGVLLGTNYATSSDVAPQFPNEWDVFGRYAARNLGPVDAAVQLGYNQAARSGDGELTIARRQGPVRLLAVARYFTDGYGAGDARTAFGGGAVIRLHRHVALAGDVATLLDRAAGEMVAWGAALQLQIPYSPHTLSLQVTNTNTATLQGVSRGIDDVRGGFEFTIPLTLGRYFGRRASSGPASGTAIEMRQLVFAPNRLEVSVGTTVSWVNRDPLEHTITADDGSWDSGVIRPEGTWSRTFDAPGTYTFHCTPHPFMTGVIVVR